jgi:hypothetical protein
MSSTYGDLYVASNIIDGSASTDAREGKCSHTGDDDTSWIKLDLGRPKVVAYLTISGRSDYDNDQSTVTIGLGLGDTFESISSVVATNEAFFNQSRKKIAVGQTAQYIWLYKAKNVTENFLNMCEVDVFGSEDPTVVPDTCGATPTCPEGYVAKEGAETATCSSSPCDTSTPDSCDTSTCCSYCDGYPDLGPLAVQAAMLSTVGFGGVADKCIDGSRATLFDDGSCCHSAESSDTVQFLKLDLGRAKQISYVMATGRGDESDLSYQSTGVNVSIGIADALNLSTPCATSVDLIIKR